MSLAASMRSLLVSLGVDVLLPEQLQTVVAGGTPSRPSGLPAYLASRQAGYVQIESPQAISSDGQQDLYWTPVATIAPTADACATLALQVRSALAGTTRDPGRYELVTPDQPRLLQVGVWVSRPSFSSSLLNGQMPQE